MTLLLAPMEGLLDYPLRDALSRAGGIDRCVTEFMRVTGTLLPERFFRRVMPELDNGGRTSSGVPVRAQLLGSDPVCLAENAGKLAALGPAGIDLNFGCPAKTVNRHRGGAVLLDEPELVGRIVTAVRRAVPSRMPVSAKMRLGNHDGSRALECAQAIAAGGADELTVHARTRLDGYRPPAYWDRLAVIRETLTIPVIANGEIWTPDDAARCRAESGCCMLMLGRGMISNPGLALQIARPGHSGIAWPELRPLLSVFLQLVEQRPGQPHHRAGRIKQWLNYLRRHYPQAEALYLQARTINDPATLGAIIAEKIE